MIEGSSLQDYLHSVERHMAELGCVGEFVADHELIQIALRNLPDSWYNFVAVYGVFFFKESPDSTFANLEEYIQAKAAQQNSCLKQQPLIVVPSPPYSSQKF